MKNIDVCENTFESALKTAVILYIECDDSKQYKTGELLKKEFEKVLIAKDIQEALSLFVNNKVDILVTNIYMPAIEGIAFLEYMKSLSPNLPCIAALGNLNAKNIIDLIGLGINNIFVHQLDINTLLIEIYKAYKVTYHYEQQEKEEVKNSNSLFENQSIHQNNKFDFKDSKSRENILFKLKYLIDEESLF